ncbi:MAG TPA: lipoyl(octanoyl) transferase LipB [Tepidisphaeraceae bacterium]|nr:lipoyl(octanoyl) transferase LipB [Tepidisphaeraceae bacterium]
MRYNLTDMIDTIDLGTLEYRKAWSVQEQIHEQVSGGGAEKILIVEHPPVITIGRRAQGAEHLLANAEDLARLGVDFVHSDRGGDITFHGPGQIVVYPIIRLNDHGLSVGGYVRALERSVIAALAQMGIAAHREDGAVGIWTGVGKICAIGVRIRRGVSLHGLALNVTTDLRYFNLIVPCGLTGRTVTSVQQILGERMPRVSHIKESLIAGLCHALQPGTLDKNALTGPPAQSA